MRATETLYRIVEELDFCPGTNLFGVDDLGASFKPKRGRERHLRDWGNNKIKADAVFVQRIPYMDSSFPLIYFRRLEENDPEQIALAHKLAWNMGQAPLLFIVLPGEVKVFNTYERPRLKGETPSERLAGLIDTLNLVAWTKSVKELAARYNRIQLESGNFWQENRKRFDSRSRVEKTLFKNLRAICERLIKTNLETRIVNSLLGRSIFIQYLEDRKDSNGHQAFPKGFFKKYCGDAEKFTDVLADKHATYEMFRHLGDKFKGDLFRSDLEDAGLEREEGNVEQGQLDLLAQFLQGDIELEEGQKCLWPLYSFDAIPIEFISNIYEEFFHSEESARQGKKGTYYTPHRLVEFMLDEVLPWDGQRTDVRVFDPACGSGIFLVEAYRRLVARWCQAKPEQTPRVDDLKKLLLNNIFGVDKNEEAIKVAAFSLYLTMCDYMRPRYIWSSVQFPVLRETNLLVDDFFHWVRKYERKERKFDLVIGNPPWESQLSEPASRYVKSRGYTVADKQIAQAFLWAAPQACDKAGDICLVAPSKGLLFTTSDKSREFRKKFFSRYNVRTVVNLSAFRDILFAKAKAPASVIFYKPTECSSSDKILYCCPKPSYSPEDNWHYIIGPQDIVEVPVIEAQESKHIWKAAMCGGPREWELIEKLSDCKSLADVCDKFGLEHGEGFIEGVKNRKQANWLTNKPYVDVDTLRPFVIDEEALMPLRKTSFNRPRKRKRRIYKGPHILVAQTPKREGFIAALLRKDAVFSQSLLGIAGAGSDEGKLGALCLLINSVVPWYYAMLTSGRWLVEGRDLAKQELMCLPVPSKIADGGFSVSYEELKELATRRGLQKLEAKGRISKLYDLAEPEVMIIEDAINYTLDYFLRGCRSIAAKPANKQILTAYTDVFCSVLNESFREVENGFCGKIYSGGGPLIVAEMMLGAETNGNITRIEKAPSELTRALERVENVLAEEHKGGVYVWRNLRIYDGTMIYIVKRNQRRFWTRSTALRDADETYADIMKAWGK